MKSQIYVDTGLCTSDGRCVAVCGSRRLIMNENGFPEEVPGRACIQCGHCVAVCPTGALKHVGLPPEPFLQAAAEFPTPSVIDSFLMSRRSVREFKDESIANETLDTLLNIARRAPTASNSQKLHWIVVNGKEKVRALAADAVNCLRVSSSTPARLEQWEKGYDFILRGAPAVIVVCTPAGYEWAKQDCAIALTFLELAAEARGFGVCWAGLLTRVAAVHTPVQRALSVPNGYVVHGGMMLGKRIYSYRLVPPRRPLSVQWI